MQTFNISGQVRDVNGKRAAKAARRAGLVPCELYGGETNIHFQLSAKDLKDLIYTSEFKVVNIEIDGTTYRCIMKDLQFHPVTDNVEHIDFLLLEDGRKVKVNVPVRFTGVAPGVKAGGKLTQKVKSVQIKTVPEALVDHLTLDISALKLGHSVRVRDIKVDGDIEIINNGSIPVASVEIPRALKSAGAAGVDEDDTEEGEEQAADGE